MYKSRFYQKETCTNFLIKSWFIHYFVGENLCDKVSKIKNLRWQFRRIFRWHCRIQERLVDRISVCIQISIQFSIGNLSFFSSDWMPISISDRDPKNNLRSDLVLRRDPNNDLRSDSNPFYQMTSDSYPIQTWSYTTPRNTKRGDFGLIQDHKISFAYLRPNQIKSDSCTTETE